MSWLKSSSGFLKLKSLHWPLRFYMIWWCFFYLIFYYLLPTPSSSSLDSLFFLDHALSLLISSVWNTAWLISSILSCLDSDFAFFPYPSSLLFFFSLAPITRQRHIFIYFACLMFLLLKFKYHRAENFVCLVHCCLHVTQNNADAQSECLGNVC